MLAGSAVLLVIGYQFIIMAMRVGEVSMVALPLHRAAGAILLGYLPGGAPDLPMIVGATVIVCSVSTRSVARRWSGAQAASESTSLMAPDVQMTAADRTAPSPVS